jgi:hypothetical protein
LAPLNRRQTDIVIEHHPETGLRSYLFWTLAFIVFLQFFTRYSPQRQPVLDRGDCALRLDVGRVHRRRNRDAQEQPHRRGALSKS